MVPSLSRGRLCFKMNWSIFLWLRIQAKVIVNDFRELQASVKNITFKLKAYIEWGKRKKRNQPTNIFHFFFKKNYC